MPRYRELAYAARLAYGRWQPPALTPADVWAGYPAWWTSPDDPLRDGFGAGLAAVFNLVSSRAARMSRMHLRKHAHGWALDLVAAAAGLARDEGERDTPLRARIGVVDDVVSPDAVAAAVRTIRPDALVLRPALHTFFVGRTPVGRPPEDYVATRAADDGRIRFASADPARVWSSYFARIHLAIPGGVDRAAPSPVGRFYVGRRGAYPSAGAPWPRQLARTLNRIRAAGVRWTATVEPT